MHNIFESLDEVHDELLRRADDCYCNDDADIVTTELLSLATNCPTVELLLIRKLICQKVVICSEVECPFHNMCYTRLNSHRGADAYILENPDEARELIEGYLKERGLEL